MNKIEYEAYKRKVETINRHDISNIVFASRSDAECVLDELFEEVWFYNRACLHRFYTACLLRSEDNERSIGWTKEDVESAHIKRKKGTNMYYISIPKPYAIKPIEPYTIIPIWEAGKGLIADLSSIAEMEVANVNK